MKLNLTPYLAAAVFAAALATPATLPAKANSCPVASPATVQSSQWDFEAEADKLFRSLESDAAALRLRADQMTTIANRPDRFSMVAHQTVLAEMVKTLGQSGDKMCRLTQIRRVVAPRQQKTIDALSAIHRTLARNINEAVRTFNDRVSTASLYATNYEKNIQAVYQDARNFRDAARAEWASNPVGD